MFYMTVHTYQITRTHTLSHKGRGGEGREEEGVMNKGGGMKLSLKQSVETLLS